MRKERKHFTPEEKVAILRRYLVDKVPVSELCEELGLRLTVFYRWQKELFENGAAAFQSQERPQRQVEEKQQGMRSRTPAHSCARRLATVSPATFRIRSGSSSTPFRQS